MRSLSVLALGLCALLPAVATADVDLTKVPDCGLTCIITQTANSTCSSPLDQACVCTNTKLLGQITECVTASCGIRDQLATKKFSSDFCGVVGEDRRSLVYILAIVFGALGLLAFCLRCLARFVGSRMWDWDDTAMCFVMLFMIPLQALSIPLSQHGLGLDMWNVSFDDIEEILHLYFFDEILYITALALTKVSILFFYLKVFPKKSFKICTWTLIAANLTYALTYDFLLIFQCDPIPGAWLFWDGTFHGTRECLNINILGWSAAAINITLDLAVILLPMPELFMLSMSMRKKLQIVAMFAVGLFITVISVVRLHSLIIFGKTSNLTQDYVEVGYWSTIEVPIGVICACMPAIRSLFSLAFPRVFGTTRGHGKSNYGSTFGHSTTAHLQSCSNGNGNLNSINKIKVKQEWTVLVDPVGGHRQDPYAPHHSRDSSDVELVRIGTLTDVESGTTTRKMTLTKEQGAWGGRPKGHGSPL
ncbi:Uu.00g008360.m01.CDS01 [Anthostomella pinea]|uniref:Uu.00g008360.m01.CDS01 n=1 Tax=Anthostomella pinea TaxID=933095 RepID=A0AAI8VX64_9PEZI|nr:Uu.00g008360.m01.CDS01 [Anthostomella pinea]